MMQDTTEVQVLKPGDKVHYTSNYNITSNGIVKSVNERSGVAWVVYTCGNDWNNYEKYTGAGTDLDDLKIGWV